MSENSGTCLDSQSVGGVVPAEGDTLTFSDPLTHQWNPILYNFAPRVQSYAADGVTQTFYTPIGTWLSTVPNIARVEISKDKGVTFTPLLLGVDYVYKYRSSNGNVPPTVADLWIGITTAIAYPAGTTVRLSWQDRRLRRTPPTLTAVHMEQLVPGGPWTIGMLGKSWGQNSTHPGTPALPNGVLATSGVSADFAIELWRWRKRYGGTLSASPSTSNAFRFGPRYIPYFRGANPNTTDQFQIVLGPGGNGPPLGNSTTQRDFVACYVHLPSGARSGFSNRITVAGSHPLRVGPPGGARFVRGVIVLSNKDAAGL